MIYNLSKSDFFSNYEYYFIPGKDNRSCGRFHKISSDVRRTLTWKYLAGPEMIIFHYGKHCGPQNLVINAGPIYQMSQSIIYCGYVKLRVKFPIMPLFVLMMQ